jgi:hypothetical protein
MCDGSTDMTMLLNTPEVWRDNQIVIYDKCNFCRGIPDDAPVKHIRPLANIGREQNTFLYFVITYYHNLPDDLILIAGSMSKYERLSHLVKLITDVNYPATCTPLHGSLRGFKLDKYFDTPQYPASIRPFGKWFEANVGPWKDGNPGPCWNGIMRTTRERLLRHSVEFYINLYKQTLVHNDIEVGHYLERAMGSVF